MQRVWVVVLSVWAMLAIVAVLAWSSRPSAAASRPLRRPDRREGPERQAAASSSSEGAGARDDRTSAVVRPMSALHRTEWRAVGTTCSAAVTVAPHDDAARRGGARCRAGGGRRLRARAVPFRPSQRPLAPQRSRRPAGPRRPPAARGAPPRTRARGEDTDGRFDPTVLPALVAAGYDRSFEQLEERAARCGATTGAPARRSSSTRGRSRATRAGRRRRSRRNRQGLRGRPGARCDARHLPDLAGGLVDLGGDIAVRGEPPEGGPWRIAIADPRRAGETLGVLALASGGVATSGRDARRFGPGSLAPPPDRPGDRRVGARPGRSR